MGGGKFCFLLFGLVFSIPNPAALFCSKSKYPCEVLNDQFGNAIGVVKIGDNQFISQTDFYHNFENYGYQFEYYYLLNVSNGIVFREKTFISTYKDSKNYCNDIPCIVRDQASCGSCYAMAIAGAAEMYYYRKYEKDIKEGKKKMFYLSEKQLMDCTGMGGGCTSGLVYLFTSDGIYLNDVEVSMKTFGWETYKFGGPGPSHSAGGGNYIKELYKKIFVTDRELYPYFSADEPCRQLRVDYYKSKHLGFTIEKYNEFIPDNNNKFDQIVKQLEEKGPLATYMDADSNFNYFFQKHGNVIYNNIPGDDKDYCAFSTMNHAVIIIGHGEENGVRYLTVRNSWGGNWGDGGDFRIAETCLRGIGDKLYEIVASSRRFGNLILFAILYSAMRSFYGA